MTVGDLAAYAVLGLGPGAVYAALGLGLLVIHRGSGVLNLAFGAMAMYPTYVYASLRSTGDLVLPGIPGTHHLTDHVPAVPALAVALAVGVLLGLTVYAVVFRTLRSAPALASVVAGVGVLLTVQTAVVLRFGEDAPAVEPLLPRQRMTIAGTVVPADRLYLVMLVAVAAAVVAVMYRSTRFGLASRGATESQEAVELLGISPSRLGAGNWAIAGAVAALFGILLAPIAGLSPNGYSLLVVPALVAAMAGRLASVVATVAGGLALGVVQSEATRFRLPWDWAPPQTLKEVIPFAALVLVLLAFGTHLPARGDAVDARLPAAPEVKRPLRRLGLLAGAGGMGTVVLTGSMRSALVVTMISVVLCLSLVVLTGYAGQVSLVQMSFAGVGALVLSRVASDWNVPFPFGALFAALAAAAAGTLLGLATSRSRGMTVALVSLGAGLTMQELLFRHLSRGILATNRVDPPRPLGLDLSPIGADGEPRVVFALFVLAVAAFTAVAVWKLRASGLGRRMLAVRDNELAASAAGIDVGRTKLVAYAVSTFIAGIGGALIGYHQTAVSGQSFGFSRSVLLLAVAYLGGLGSIGGAVVGGLVIPGGLVPTAADRLLDLGEYSTLVSGIVVTFLVVRRTRAMAR